MSELFSLLKESCIPSDMFASTYSKERYIETTINMLESVNDDITDKTKQLYNLVSEANDVSDENQAIRNFIVEIQQKLDKVIIDTNAFVSRFSIAVSNYADSAREVIKKCTITQGFSYEDKYTEYNKKNLLNSSVPNMNPYRIFEREFNFIAQLMQELPVSASNKDKLDIVATVYDKFKSNMNTGDTNKRVCDDIFGTSADESPFSRRVACLFKGTIAPKTIDSEVYNDAVECISNSGDYIRSVSELANELINDLKGIIMDLNDIVSNSYKNRFKVDTKEDGIRNTIYSVDVYTSNKIMWFVQDKIQQIVDVFNKYILALTIKMDCIIGYITQSSDIITSFAYMNGETPTPEKEYDDDEVDNFEDGPEDDDIGTDDFGDDLTEEEGDTNTDDDFLEPESDDDADEIPEDIEETAPEFESYDDPEIQEAVKNYYIELHELSCEFNRISLIEHAAMIILEEEEKKDSSDDKPSEPLKNAKETVGKAAEVKESIWKRVIKSTVNLWNKFKDNIVKNYSGKVDHLKENEKFIMTKPLDHKIDMPKIDHKKIESIKVPDLNYDGMKADLESEAKFMASQSELKPFAPSGEGESINSKVMDFVISPKEKITNSKDIAPSVIYNEYCKDFVKILDSLKDITKTIEDGERKANQIAKNIHSESAEFSIENYFVNEFKDEGNDKGGASKAEGKETSVANTTNHLKVYFSTCGKVLAAKMTVSQKVFNEYYAYLMWHIKKKKEGKGESSDGEGDQGSAENKDTENTLTFE